MICLKTEDCWCADCTDRAMTEDRDSYSEYLARRAQIRRAGRPVDIAWIFENGLEQKLSDSVRCF